MIAILYVVGAGPKLQTAIVRRVSKAQRLRQETALKGVEKWLTTLQARMWYGL